MRDLDVAEVRRRDEVPEGTRVWSGRWCHRKKAGGVRSRYVVRQHRVVRGRLLRDPGLGGHSHTSCSGVSHALDGDARGDFLDGVHAHAPAGLRRALGRAAEGGRAGQALRVGSSRRRLTAWWRPAKRFQQYLFRLLRDLRSGVRELPLAADPAEEPDHRDHHGGARGRPDGQRSAR